MKLCSMASLIWICKEKTHTALTSPLEQYCTTHLDCTQPANCDDNGICVVAIEPSATCSTQKDATQCVDGFECTSISSLPPSTSDTPESASAPDIPEQRVSCTSTEDCIDALNQGLIFTEGLVCSSETDDAATPDIVENGVCS